jgi:two-component system, LytTR family, response regulator
MRALIIDDEDHCITTLKWTLNEYCKEVNIVATANNGHDGIQLIKLHQPDLIFLDIEMPQLNGIEMLQQCDIINFEVIFTTAYDQYAVKAIKLNALDYLLKPIDKDDLVEAVSRVKAKQAENNKVQVTTSQEVHKTKVANKIALSTSSGLQFVNLENLMRIEGQGNYCNFILKDKKSILLCKKLGEAEEILKEDINFFRAHKSHIVNLKYVEKYNRGEGGEIIMEDGTSIALSRNKKDEFLLLFNRV